MATIGQFDPDEISAGDPQSDFTAVVFPDTGETVPNLTNRRVRFTEIIEGVGIPCHFGGTVIDHSGNEVTIEYRVTSDVPDTIYLVEILAPSGDSSQNIHSTDAIEVVV